MSTRAAADRRRQMLDYPYFMLMFFGDQCDLYKGVGAADFERARQDLHAAFCDFIQTAVDCDYDLSYDAFKKILGDHTDAPVHLQYLRDGAWYDGDDIVRQIFDAAVFKLNARPPLMSGSQMLDCPYFVALTSPCECTHIIGVNAAEFERARKQIHKEFCSYIEESYNDGDETDYDEFKKHTVETISLQYLCSGAWCDGDDILRRIFDAALDMFINPLQAADDVSAEIVSARADI